MGSNVRMGSRIGSGSCLRRLLFERFTPDRIRGLVVQIEVADRAFTLNRWVMRGQGAGVAPVTIEAPRFADGRCPTDFEQQCRGFEHLLDRDLLSLKRLDIGCRVDGGFGLAGESRFMNGLHRCRDLVDDRIRRKRKTRQPSDHALHERVFTRIRQARHTEGTGLGLNKRDRIAKHRVGDAREHCKVEGLIERRDIGVGRMLAGLESANHMGIVEVDITKARGAAAGQALTEAVPVVDDTDTRSVRRHRKTHPCFTIARRGDDPVRVDRAGAVVLVAVERPLIIIGTRERDGRFGRGGALCHRRTE